MLASTIMASVIGGGVANAETANILGGALTATNTPIAFSDVTLDLTQAQSSTATSSALIDDARGSGAGWSYNLAITNFTASVEDPTIAGGTLSVDIPASAVNFSVIPPTLLAGQAIDPTYGPAAGTGGTLSSTAQPILNASPGFGMGQYSADLNFSIDIPKTIEISNVSDLASKFQAGDTAGIFAGQYTSTFTFTTGAGL